MNNLTQRLIENIPHNTLYIIRNLNVQQCFNIYKIIASGDVIL